MDVLSNYILIIERWMRSRRWNSWLCRSPAYGRLVTDDDWDSDHSLLMSDVIE